ncbi:hypothetical protein LZ30DRAFT_124625 [Colletotrichum cereale]|nr:hypothetical protein LZ30DRAFT_124625 [Colletotrichum cereale]
MLITLSSEAVSFSTMDSLSTNKSATLPPLRSPNKFSKPLLLQHISKEALNITHPPNVNYQDLPNVRFQLEQEVKTKDMHYPQRAYSHASQAMSPLPQQSQQRQMLPAGEHHASYPVTQACVHSNNATPGQQTPLLGGHSHATSQLRGRDTDEPTTVSLPPAAPGSFGISPSAAMSYDYYPSPHHYPVAPSFQQIVPSWFAMQHNYNPEIALSQYQALTAQLHMHNSAALRLCQAGPLQQERMHSFRQVSLGSCYLMKMLTLVFKFSTVIPIMGIPIKYLRPTTCRPI